MRIKDDIKRSSIIHQTLDIVYKDGLSGIKMADLAKRVGVSPSTLYVYFKNKQDLIVTITSELIEQEAINSAKEITDDLPYKLKLKTLWLFWLNFGVNHSKEMSFLNQVKQSPYYGLVPELVKESKMKLGLELIELGKKEGLLKNINNEIIVSVFEAMLKETVSLVMNKEFILDQRNIDLMFSLVWDAIKS